MTRTSKDNHSPQEDYDSDTSGSRASTPDQQQLAPVTAPSLQCSANSCLQSAAFSSSTTVTRSESPKIPSAKPSPVSSPTPIRRSSCGDQFASRQQQYRTHTVSYPRDTGRRYYVRERKDSEDLMANLLNLRDLLLNQNVHV